MKKYYFKDSNIEFNPKENVTLTTNKEHSYSVKQFKKLNDIQIKALLDLEIIEEREEEFIPTDIEYYIRAFGEGLGRYDSDAEDLFLDLYRMYPIETLCILWREIMSEFDLVYRDNIEIYNKVYVIHKQNGAILEIDNTKEHINDDRFVVFRTKEDAELAIEITKDYYNEVFRK